MTSQQVCNWFNITEKFLWEINKDSGALKNNFGEITLMEGKIIKIPSHCIRLGHYGSLSSVAKKFVTDIETIRKINGLKKGEKYDKELPRNLKLLRIRIKG